ncbi:hypothetical protein D3C81_672120 [compost metagenome]
MRHADHRDIRHAGVGGKQVLDFLGVDIDAARQDQVGAAPGEIETAVFIHVADIAEGRAAVRIVGLGGLLRIVVVGKARRAREPDAALLPGWQRVARLVLDVDIAQQRGPDRARPAQPLLAVDAGQADALGAAVVLVPDLAPPFDHAELDVGRARRGGMDRHPHARQVGLLPHCVGQRQQADHHGRHPLAVRDAVLRDQPQGLFGVEAA